MWLDARGKFLAKIIDIVEILGRSEQGITKLERLRRLRNRNFPHGDILLPVTSPDEEGQRGEAFRDIRDELAKEFDVTDISDVGKIIDFANVTDHRIAV